MEGYRGIWEDKEGVEKKMEVLSYVGVKGLVVKFMLPLRYTTVGGDNYTRSRQKSIFLTK